MADFSPYIQPLDPFEGKSGFGTPALPAEQPVPGVEPVNAAVRQDRQAKVAAALQALGAGLAAFASRDPGRAALTFIQQQVANRARMQEIERQEAQLNKQLRSREREGQVERAHETGLAKQRLSHETESQERQIEATAAQNAKLREHQLDMQSNEFEFRMTEGDKDFIRQKQLIGVRTIAEKALIGERATREDEVRAAAELRRLQTDVLNTSMALGVDGADAVHASQQIAQFYSGQIGRSALDTDTLSVLSALQERTAAAEQIKTETELAQLQAVLVNNATTQDPGEMSPTFKQALYERGVQRLPEGLSERLSTRDPMLEAAQTINAVEDKLESGEELTPQEIDQARQAYQTFDPSGEGAQQFEARMKGVDPERTDDPYEAAFRGSIQGAAAALINPAQAPEHLRGAYEYGKRGGQKVAEATGIKTLRDVFRTPDVTADTPVWEGNYADTPVGHAVQHPDSGTWMIRGANMFHAFDPSKLQR